MHDYSLLRDELRRVGGVARQQLPDAQMQRQAASAAAAAKRVASAMPRSEKLAKKAEAERMRRQLQRDQEQLWLPRVEDDSGSDTDTTEDLPSLEELNAILAAEDIDEIDIAEFHAFTNWAVSYGLGLHDESYADWTHSPEYDSFQLDRDVDDWEADGMPQAENRQEYCLPYAELCRRLDEDLGPHKGETQFDWDKRVAAARTERGISLGDYLQSDAISAGEHIWQERAPWRDSLSPTQQKLLPAPPGGEPPSPPSIEVQEEFHDRTGTQCYLTGEERFWEELAPRPLGNTGLIEAFDPETEQPYYYIEGDVTRARAQYYGCLDTTVAAPDWGLERVPSPRKPAAPKVTHKPRRSNFPRGAAGKHAFRQARAQWFEAKTGSALEGSVPQQVTQADNMSRNERMRNGRTT